MAITRRFWNGQGGGGARGLGRLAAGLLSVVCGVGATWARDAVVPRGAAHPGVAAQPEAPIPAAVGLGGPQSAGHLGGLQGGRAEGGRAEGGAGDEAEVGLSAQPTQVGVDRWRAPRLGVPEPMVFDLVRGLDAERFELEANTLMVLDPRRPGQVTWAPEVELALADGLAVELELPMQAGTVMAYKAAVQATFESDTTLPLLHGTQVIAEYARDHGALELSALYLLGVRLGPRWSLMGMLGVRSAVTGPDRPADTLEFLQNVSLFRALGSHHQLGLETNLARGLDGETSGLLMPQLHWHLSGLVKMQVGAGVSLAAERLGPAVGSRLIFEL